MLILTFLANYYNYKGLQGHIIRALAKQCKAILYGHLQGNKNAGLCVSILVCFCAKALHLIKSAYNVLLFLLITCCYLCLFSSCSNILN